MGWRDDPLAQPGPVSRPAPVVRPENAQPRRPMQAAPAMAAPAQPSWKADPLVNAPAAAAPQPEGPLSWADVPGKALENAPKSALEFGTAVVQPFLHPIDTAKGIFDIGYGLASKLHGATGATQDPEQKAKDEAAANLVGEHFSKRYGSVQGFKEALASDPVGVIADVSIVLTGGGALASRGPGVVGAAGRAAQATGNAIDPLLAAGRTVRGVGTAAANVLGLTTGAGTRPFQEAFNAGRTGNPEFARNMRGQAQARDVVDMADRAVTQMGRDRSAAYEAGMQTTRNSTQFADLRPAERIINQARRENTHTGVTVDRGVAAVLDEMDGIVREFGQAAQAPGTRTPGLLDAIKRALSGVYERTAQGTPENRAAGQVYRAVRDEIARQVPEYAQTMRDYQNANDEIGEARRALSVNNKATTDTTLRKLQSTMRDNVNTNWGERARLLDVLAQYEPNLPPALGGQALAAWAPRGLARYAAGTGAMTSAVTNPWTLPMLSLTLPRLMGEAALATGRAAGGIEQAANALGMTPAMLLAAARSGYLLNQMGGDQARNPLMAGYGDR